jgi:hypothetical protein
MVVRNDFVISPNLLGLLARLFPWILAVPLQGRCQNMGSVTSCIEWGVRRSRELMLLRNWPCECKKRSTYES